MRIKLIFLLLFFGFGGFSQNIPDRPNPPRLVNDFVGNLLSADQIQSLENKLVAYNDSTSTQIAVVIIKSTEPYEISDYAVQLGRKWGVGQKDKNNGLVILWAPGDRKVTIQTGYGMEGVVPDAYASRIINNIIRPNFQNLQYYKGLDEAIDAIINYSKGEYQAAPEEDEGISGIMLFVFLLFIIFIIFIISKGDGGNSSGGRGINHDSSWPYTTYTGWGRQSGNWGGGGFGGGFGGGGSGFGGGGGFGGFGGGSFGGGGASGGY